jgi:outer membrane protein assembly factor BamA
VRTLFVRFFIALFFIVSFGLRHVFSQANQPPNLFTKKDSATTVLYKDKLLVFPLVALSKETSWVFGVANAFIFKTNKNDSTLRFSTIPSGLLYTLNNQILVALGANIFLPKERYIIRFENSASKFPDKFWGIGNDTDNNSYESYTYTQFYINPQIYRKVARNFFLGLGLDYQRVFHIQYESGGYFDQEKVLGVYDKVQYHVFGYSFFINYDSRNHTYVPNKGELFRLRFTNFDKNIGSDYAFQAFELDYRKFIKITRHSVLAIHSLGLFNLGDPPFRNLALLGGNSIMRGYYQGRYRDNKFWGAQVEYRFPIKGRFGGVAFAGAGQVAHVFSDFGMDRFKPSVGTGLRFAVLKQEKLNLRFDVALGNNSFNYYIVLAESF